MIITGNLKLTWLKIWFVRFLSWLNAKSLYTTKFTYLLPVYLISIFLLIQKQEKLISKYLYKLRIFCPFLHNTFSIWTFWNTVLRKSSKIWTFSDVMERICLIKLLRQDYVKFDFSVRWHWHLILFIFWWKWDERILLYRKEKEHTFCELHILSISNRFD